jgi:hypothetical protein
MEAAPEWVESVSRLSFPDRTNRRIKNLMARNNEGQLSESEREELASLVEMSESIALIRSEALRMLGRRP